MIPFKTVPSTPRMNRKSLLKGLALGTLSLPFLLRGTLGDTLAQTDTGAYDRPDGRTWNWRMVTTWPPNFPILDEGCKLFAEWVRVMSGGRLNIQVYGGGELVPALECFDAVRSGAAEMGSGAAYYWAGKVPAAQFFASVPFGMNAQQHSTWILHGGGLELWREVYGNYGLVPYLAGNTGLQMGGWFRREIRSIDDLRGLKMRIPGLGGKVLAKAGGTPVLLAGGELYTGLERGVIDATEWIGPYHDTLMGFPEIAPYYYTPGWHELGTAFELFANRDALHELPPDLQLIVETAALRLNDWTWLAFEAKNAEYLGQIQRGPTDIRRFPKPVLDQLRTLTDEVIAELTTRDPLARRVYASYDAFRKQMKPWAELTEQVYYGELMG